MIRSCGHKRGGLHYGSLESMKTVSIHSFFASAFTLLPTPDSFEMSYRYDCCYGGAHCHQCCYKRTAAG
jgi:hypothetical protein